MMLIKKIVTISIKFVLSEGINKATTVGNISTKTAEIMYLK